MAVMLFGGLTAIGVAYGLTALPVAGRIPLVLIIVPISVVAAFSEHRSSSERRSGWSSWRS